MAIRRSPFYTISSYGKVRRLIYFRYHQGVKGESAEVVYLPYEGIP